MHDFDYYSRSQYERDKTVAAVLATITLLLIVGGVVGFVAGVLYWPKTLWWLFTYIEWGVGIVLVICIAKYLWKLLYNLFL